MPYKINKFSSLRGATLRRDERTHTITTWTSSELSIVDGSHKLVHILLMSVYEFASHTNNYSLIRISKRYSSRWSSILINNGKCVWFISLFVPYFDEAVRGVSTDHPDSSVFSFFLVRNFICAWRFSTASEIVRLFWGGRVGVLARRPHRFDLQQRTQNFQADIHSIIQFAIAIWIIVSKF